MYIELKTAFTMMRKRITQSILIGIIIMLISMLLYVGVSLISQAAPFEEMYARANAAENMIILTKHSDDTAQTIKWYEDVQEVDKVVAYEISMSQIEYEDNGETISELVFLAEYIEENDIDVLYTDSKTIVTSPKENQIIVSHSYAKNRNLEIGDMISYKHNDQVFEFEISNIAVDPQFSTAFISPPRCFIEPDFFDKYGIENDMQIVSVKYHNIDEVDDNALFAAFIKEQTEILSPMFVDYRNIKNSYNIILGVISAILLAVSILIFIIVVFVIRSTLQNQILSQYKQIGVKKAIGYTSNQIRNSMFFAYGIIGIITSTLGVFIGLPIRRLVNSGIASDIQVGMDATADIFMPITVVLVVALIITFSWIATAKASHVKPVQAIKYGMPEREVNNNKFSIIDSKRKPLSLLLAIKQLLASKRKTITTTILFTLLVYVALMIGNLGTTLASPKHFATYMFGMRIGDASISVTQGESVKGIYGEIMSIEDISQCAIIKNKIGTSYITQDGNSQALGEMLVYGSLPDDFAKVTQGRQPYSNDEIVISSEVEIASGKTVGDYMTIKGENGYTDYLVTGTFNSVSNSMHSYFKYEKDIPSNMKSDGESYWIYSESGDFDLAKIDNLAKQKIGMGAKATWFDSNTENVIGTLAAFPMVVQLLLLVFMIVSGIIILNSTIMNINNSKKVYGIMKATGFSNAFLTKVLVVQALIVAIIGITIGFILNMFTMQLVMDAVFEITPFSSINMPVIFDDVKSSVLAILFLVISVIATLLPSKKIGSVSPKQLISE